MPIETQPLAQENSADDTDVTQPTMPSCVDVRGLEYGDVVQRENAAETSSRVSLRVVSLFSGAGGLDLGLERAGHRVVQLCENWEPAKRVLRERFPKVPLADDVRTLNPTSDYDLLAAGFPCVDLSHAGKQRGIFGPNSGLVKEVFRIAAQTRPRWILIENVTNLLRLGRGAGISYILDSLRELGYSWAYRVLDSRFTGVPQRRRRVFILASLDGDPASVLLGDEEEPPKLDEATVQDASASGFYWTEGRRGVGLVEGAIPTLKGGSTLGLPSAPAIWQPTAPVGRKIVLPSIVHAERLQGFPDDWTAPAREDGEPDRRWKLVGNAVTVGVGEWIGHALSSETTRSGLPEQSAPLNRDRPWPDAAFGQGTTEWRFDATDRPRQHPMTALADIVADGATSPLSRRATAGFLSRVRESGIKLNPTLLLDLEQHETAMDDASKSWASSPAVRKRMQRTGSKDGSAEVALRRSLTARGARYRLQVGVVPGARWRSDIVFARARVVVDVRGCFWHACPEHGTQPKSNAGRWATKLADNRARDDRMVDDLTRHGWHVEVVWEHEDPDAAAERVFSIVSARRTQAVAS
ncbi:DNA (cytosine-5-)-methyltransferase [Curtobacterium sp. VKM Ac-1376]|uniref:DNA (cytosine-5-)-methyltransferase n=1 Tax=Curtobacterium sp. VKM Ac-1376 TaxID=123312 RepID=UPI00188A0445|nr:DNA (cytosine-5-)-methyltransferase [Curtobacterium sp. VKM Ac-1376]MBF4615466.1 DNA (cytosine-5-)-methyltransferase [Curtobacterium sp. VKM Ac-1376]